jgi:hypothetical protein
VFLSTVSICGRVDLKGASALILRKESSPRRNEEFLFALPHSQFSVKRLRHYEKVTFNFSQPGVKFIFGLGSSRPRLIFYAQRKP